MPYRKIPFCSGNYYHIYNRGNNYEKVFFEPENYRYFLRLLQKYCPPSALELVSYCLMPDHYHLLVFLNENDLSNRMQAMILAYTKAINKRYGRVGALFQGRFKALHVDKYDYLLHLSRYIHYNPVAAGLVQRAEDWVFSSYPVYLGLRREPFLQPDIVMSQFDTPGIYREFVESLSDEDIAIIQHLVGY